MWLRRQTYNQLNKDLAETQASSIKWMTKFLEMEQRKDYLKDEFTRVSTLFDECKEQQKRLNIGLEKTLNDKKRVESQLLESQDQCMRLTTGLAKSFSTEEILKKQLTAAQDLIKKLNRVKE